MNSSQAGLDMKDMAAEGARFYKLLIVTQLSTLQMQPYTQLPEASIRACLQRLEQKRRAVLTLRVVSRILNALPKPRTN